MLKSLKNNEKGVIFVTVLMIVIVMMVLVVSIVSMNVSQVTLAENEIRRVQAEILAMGALARTYGNQLSNSTGNFIQYTVDFGNFTYLVTSNVYSGNLLDITVQIQ